LVLCRSEWMIKCLSFFLVPSWSSSTPLYPWKCCEPRSVFRLLVLSLFSLQIHTWNLLRSHGAHQQVHIYTILERILKSSPKPSTYFNTPMWWWFITLKIQPKLAFFLFNPCQHGGRPIVVLTWVSIGQVHFWSHLERHVTICHGC